MMTKQSHDYQFDSPEYIEYIIVYISFSEIPFKKYIKNKDHANFTTMFIMVTLKGSKSKLNSDWLRAVQFKCNTCAKSVTV